MLSCDACRVAKKKCNRKRPCERCSEKNLECTYDAKSYHSEVVPKYRQYEDRLKKLEKMVLEIRKLNGLPKIDPELIYFNNNFSANNFFGFCYKVPSNNSVVKSSQDTKAYLKNLLDIFLSSLLPPFPFINPATLRAKFEINPFDSPLLTAAYCRTQLYLNQFSGSCCVPSVQDNYFYKLTSILLLKNSDEISLESIQALILTALIELETNACTAFRRHCTEAIKKANIMYLHDPDSMQRMADIHILKLEKDATWSMIFLLDYLSSCIWGLPHLMYDLPTTITSLDDVAETYQSLYPSQELSDPLAEQFSAMKLYVAWVKIFSVVNSHKGPLQPFNIFFAEQFKSRYKLASDLLTKIQDILPPLLCPAYFNSEGPQHPARAVHLSFYLLHHSILIDLVELLINCAKIEYMQEFPEFVAGCQEFHFIRVNSARLLNQVLEPIMNTVVYDQTCLDLNFVSTIAYYHMYKSFMMDLVSPNSKLFADRAKQQFMKHMKYYPSLNRILVNLDILETEPKTTSSNGGFQFIGVCTSPICPFTASRQIRP